VGICAALVGDNSAQQSSNCTLPSVWLDGNAWLQGDGWHAAKIVKPATLTVIGVYFISAL